MRSAIAGLYSASFGRGTTQADRPVRSATYATRGLVIAPQPLAAETGLDVLQSGGTAADAIIAASGLLCVSDPVRVGLGGHLTALCYDGGSQETIALQSIGRRVGETAVPGLVDGWDALHGRFGRKPLADLLTPAIERAEAGVPIGDAAARVWRREAAGFLRRREPAATPETVLPLLPGHTAPQPGQIFTRPELAATLRLIALRGRAPLYEGSLATPLLETLNAAADGDRLTSDQLADRIPQWLPPLAVDYRGRTIATGPRGEPMLEALQLLSRYQVGSLGSDPSDVAHLLLEADRVARLDPAAGGDRLNLSRAIARRRLIDPNRSHALAGDPLPETSIGSGLGLIAVDADGNVCAAATGLGQPFGCGRTLPSTGILLPAADATWPLPLLVLDRGEPTAALTVSGPGEPSRLALQAVTALLDFGRSATGIVDAARIDRIDGSTALRIEDDFSLEARATLARRGYDLLEPFGDSQSERQPPLGRVQVVTRRPIFGTLAGSADPRGDGAAAGY